MGLIEMLNSRSSMQRMGVKSSWQLLNGTHEDAILVRHKPFAENMSTHNCIEVVKALRSGRARAKAASWSLFVIEWVDVRLLES